MKKVPKKTVVAKVKQSVIKQFPEFKTIKPLISTVHITPQTSIFKKLALGVPRRPVRVYRMNFTKKVKAEDNVILTRILSATFNEQGHILKITESK